MRRLRLPPMRAHCRVSLDDLAAQQTALFLDGYIASASRDGKRGNE
jgi:hypothetical protein